MSEPITPATGQQYWIQAGAYRACISSVGASLRVLRHEQGDLLLPFDANRLRPGFHGAVLAPWPNRIVDGRYHHAGTTEQLPLTEVARGHALHGLVCWQEWTAVEEGEHHVTLHTEIAPQPGYPHRLRLLQRYLLDEQGLHGSLEVTNLGNEPAPFGNSIHPYFVAGNAPADQWTLQLPADLVLLADEKRLIPEELAPVDEHREFDFRTARRLESQAIDHAFGGLRHDSEGTVTISLVNDHGQGVQLAFSAEDFRWVQVYTSDDEPPAAHRAAVAIEPMTCPPDAFNSGTDLIHLAPGQPVENHWSVSAVKAPALATGAPSVAQHLP
ncbi:aldose 1-epimerase family protein [Glutamicibacter sp. PS]|uniref:aldose 1-epimerase family protein n=1 Tax=Glutamicibacter sp. PS TaxID=3075634 RepID=UPI0028451240|nr:aldose 1-epimerase family protein [Glutamicibacter sp. PS]MDR4533658.1 aldose 1-epimerase family protein [Glutamicibacter sp. PS]